LTNTSPNRTNMKPIAEFLPDTNQVATDDALAQDGSACGNPARLLTTVEMAAVSGGPEIKNSIGN
jgi:hypothetical protein